MPSGTLYEYLGEQAAIITPSTRIELARGIAEGLNYLHSENVVHGDLHPGNVLIDGSGNPCLIDFGLAAVIDDRGAPRLRDAVLILVGVRLKSLESTVTQEDQLSRMTPILSAVSCSLSSREGHPARPHSIYDSHWELIKNVGLGNRDIAWRLLHWVQSMTEYSQWIAGDQNPHSTASATIPTRLWRLPQGLRCPYVPQHRVSYPTSHTPTPVVASTCSWAPTGETTQQYHRAAFTGPIPQSRVLTQHIWPLAPSCHGQPTRSTPSKLADLVSQGSRLGESWASFMRGVGIPQSHVFTQHNPPLAPSYHDRLTRLPPSELADLVSQHSGLDGHWASFMRDVGIPQLHVFTQHKPLPAPSYHDRLT
ncbi:hypothetical protein M405DRAFT_856496 [Rhizopogon salebrosus TDB-379]|nr:hypothetical protein M405DRAFT_856496 [Rhizopogon salebrosus TDB-379]